MRRSLPLAPAILSALLLSAAPADAAVTAVLVGIDAYDGPPVLTGAVNDVRDLAAVLRSAGARVIVLENEAASRAAFISAVTKAAAAAGPEDLVYVHFSGHGISVPDVDRDEADGRDEAYLMAAFDETDGPGEMLLDDDLDRLFGALGRDVLFVADACHSGSPARAVSGPALPTRLYRPRTDPVRPPPPDVDAAVEGGRVFALGATTDDRSIPEMLIEGRPRGALSYATARAIEGAGDLDGDGRLAMRELEVYVRQAVRTLAASKQTPQFGGPSEDRVVIDMARAGADKPAAAPLAEDLPVVSVHVLAGKGEGAVVDALERLAGVRLVATPAEASLLVDPAAGLMMNVVRDVILAGAGPGSLVPAIEAQRVLGALEQAALVGSPTIRLEPGDAVLGDGTRIAFTVDGLRHPHLTVFDLAADGTVHFLWPLSSRDRDPWPAGETFRLDAEVSPPFGADTLVVVATDRPPEALRAALAAVDGRRRPLLLHEAMAATRRTMRTDVGLQAFFTAGGTP